MSSTAMQDRIIALSAVIQAAKLVQNIALKGQADQADMLPLLNSLVMDSAPSTEALYGGIGQLKTGIKELNSQLSKQQDRQEMSVLRYVIAVLHLEQQLAKQPEMLATINQLIEQVPTQIEYFGSITAPQVIARFADIYQRTISELSPRIQVQGDPTFLQQADNVNKVRALLLSAIRAAMVWRQKGGRRWHFLFQSRKILNTAEALYSAT